MERSHLLDSAPLARPHFGHHGGAVRAMDDPAMRPREEPRAAAPRAAPREVEPAAAVVAETLAPCE